jgi:hypothetical protein
MAKDRGALSFCRKYFKRLLTIADQSLSNGAYRRSTAAIEKTMK